jgi:hypothetical protein
MFEKEFLHLNIFLLLEFIVVYCNPLILQSAFKNEDITKLSPVFENKISAKII